MFVLLRQRVNTLKKQTKTTEYLSKIDMKTEQLRLASTYVQIKIFQYFIKRL